MAKDSNKERKLKLYAKTQSLFKNRKNFLVVNMNNITATQLQNTKKEFENAEFLFGKNTTIKRALNDMNITKYDEFLKGNTAFIFSDDVKKMKEILYMNKRNTYAKVGAIAQEDMWIENMITGMGPDKTSFFQALGINTKITKGKVEIISRAQTLYKGQKVTPSQANLLKVMNIKPFIYFMEILAVCEGDQIYSPDILDISDSDIDEMFSSAIQNIAALSLSVGISTEASANYEFTNAVRDVVCVSLASKFDIPLASNFK